MCCMWSWNLWVVFDGHGFTTPLLGLGTAMCNNLHADHMYLVGSEEGKIYKCSKAFKDRYMDVYHVRTWTSTHVPTCTVDSYFKFYGDKTMWIRAFSKGVVVGKDVSLIVQAHHMAIHALKWNPFHPNVFASCGADWTVKIWDHTRKWVCKDLSEFGVMWKHILKL